MYMYLLIYKYVSYFVKRGGRKFPSELFTESFVSCSLRIGAEHIPVCPSFVH